MDLYQFGIQFELVWAFFVCLWPIAVYVLARRFTKNSKIAALSSALTLTIAGTELALLGSVGTSFGYLLAMVIFLLVILRSEEVITGTKVSAIIILLIGVLLTIHLLPIVFTAILLGMYYFVSLIFRRLTFKEFMARAIETGLGGLAGFGILFFFEYSLLIGIFDEIARKSSGSGESVSAVESYLNYLVPQIDGISSVIDPIIIPLVLVGAVYLWRSRNWPILMLTGFSLLYIFIPLFTFPRAIYYIMVPMTILAGIGFFHILQMIKTFSITKSTFSGKITPIVQFLIVIMVFSPTLVIQYYSVEEPDTFRAYSELDEELFHPLGVAHWVLENVTRDRVIAYPSAGAAGRVFSTIVENKVYFAERRYSDLRQYQDIAGIYGGYYAIDVGEVIYPFEERLQIIERYNISVIIEGYSFRLRNVTLWRAAYPHMQSFALYDAQYVVRILY
ncbi:MAG: hypothetical protein P1Q69_10900 [Candidatus Thorarchaeota archaeon]|nr:hypothetical protein [Candidatus Thorarchaeota archaeon]